MSTPAPIGKGWGINEPSGRKMDLLFCSFWYQSMFYQSDPYDPSTAETVAVIAKWEIDSLVFTDADEVETGITLFESQLFCLRDQIEAGGVGIDYSARKSFILPPGAGTLTITLHQSELGFFSAWEGSKTIPFDNSEFTVTVDVSADTRLAALVMLGDLDGTVRHYLWDMDFDGQPADSVRLLNLSGEDAEGDHTLSVGAVTASFYLTDGDITAPLIHDDAIDPDERGYAPTTFGPHVSPGTYEITFTTPASGSFGPVDVGLGLTRLYIIKEVTYYTFYSPPTAPTAESEVQVFEVRSVLDYYKPTQGQTTAGSNDLKRLFYAPWLGEE